MNDLDVLVLDPSEVLWELRSMHYRGDSRKEIRRLFNLRKADLTQAMYRGMADVGTPRRQCDRESANGQLISLLKIPVEKRKDIFLTPRSVKF